MAVSVLSAALAAPLLGFLSGPVVDSGDFVAGDLPFLVESDGEMRVEFAGVYVPAELLVKFVRGQSFP